LQQGVVQQFGWLNDHQFLDAVAVAMITPGPVVITVAFIGYLARSAGLAGSIMASIGIFLPVYIFTIVPAPWFKRHRDNAQLKAFVDGATAAATGAITGAVLVLTTRAITDLPTAAIALISLAVLWRYKIPEPIIVSIAGLIGLIVYLIFHCGFLNKVGYAQTDSRQPRRHRVADSPIYRSASRIYIRRPGGSRRYSKPRECQGFRCAGSDLSAQRWQWPLLF